MPQEIKQRPKNIVKAYVENYDKFDRLSKGDKISFIKQKIIMQQLMGSLDKDSLKAIDDLSSRLQALREKQNRSTEDIAEERKIIKTVEPIVNQQELLMKRKMQLINKNTKIPPISNTGIRLAKDTSRKTLFDYQTINACESRFENLNLTPNIASKYKRNDRGFSMKTQSQRDSAHLTTNINGELKSSEEIGNKPPILGNVTFNKQIARKPMINVPEKGLTVDIYRYVDSVSSAFKKFQSPKVQGYTMEKTKGRDNAMYNVSEYSNLKDQSENALNQLLSLREGKNSSTVSKVPGNEYMTPLRQISSLF